jgi:excisionase family DNA binding protein
MELTKLLNTQQAAKQAGVAESTIRHAIKMRKLKATRLGEKSWVIMPDDLQAWASNRRMGRPPKSGA